MRDAKTIKTVLHKAAQVGSETRVASADACLARLLSEMDAVILPRDIEFDNGAGLVLSLTVKSRRLIRVNAPVARQLGTFPEIVETELTGQAEQMVALVRMMAAFAAKTTELSVTATRPKHPDMLTEVGLSTAQLRDAVVSAGYNVSSEAEDVLEALRRVADGNGLSWIWVENGDVSGGQGDVSALQVAAGTTLPYVLKTERPKSNQPTSLMFGSGDDPRTAITVQGSRCLIALVPNALTQDWIATCAGLGA